MDRLVEIFLKTECKNALFQMNVQGISIWNYLRLETFRMIERQITGNNLTPVPYRQVFLDDGFHYSPSEQADYESKLISMHKGDALLIINNKHRFVEFAGKRICPVTGMIETVTDAKIGYCTQVYNRGKFRTYDNENDVNYNRIHRTPRLELSEAELIAISDKIVDLFGEAYGIQLNELFVCDFKNHIRYVTGIMDYMDFYKRLLSTIRPNLVIVSSYYATVDSLIIAEAKHLGIPTLEMQHGTIGNEHVAYNCLENRSNEPGVPDYLAAYGQFDLEVPRHFVPKERIILSGNLFMEHLRQELMRVPRANSQKQVLIVSFNIQNEPLVELAIELKQLRPAWNIIYRFHPEETIIKENRQRMEKWGIHCNDDFSVSIYGLIACSDCIVGTKSTVMYEALCFEKPSFIVTTDSDRTNWRESEKHMPHVSNAKELLSLLSDTELWSETMTLSSRFYCHNGSKNLAALINGLLKGAS